ncbi:MAG: cytochrome c biogenesis CcdA family protein [Candidatus Hodarchaeota archaeon]
MMIFGIHIDESIGLPIYFLSGLYVALSPCLFPIMPLTVFRIMSKSIITEEGEKKYFTRKLAIQWVILLTSGILVTFIVAILIMSYIWDFFGVFLINQYIELTFILGILLIIMGVFLLIPLLSEKTFAKIPIPQSVSNIFQKEEIRHLDLFLIGFGYSFIALPCAAPAFISLLGISSLYGNSLSLIIGIGLFAIGLSIPYFLLVLVTAEARTRLTSFFTENFRIIEIIFGIIIILFGFLFIWPSFGGPILFSL